MKYAMLPATIDGLVMEIEAAVQATNRIDFRKVSCVELVTHHGEPQNFLDSSIALCSLIS
jgi:hypothetical protein